METNTLEAAVKPPPIDDAKMFKHAKEMEKSTGTLLYIDIKKKYIFLYFKSELSDASYTSYKGSNTSYKEIRLRPETVSKRMDEFDKLKKSLNPETESFVIKCLLDDKMLDEICNEASSKEASYIRAFCYTQQVSDGKEGPGKNVLDLLIEWMDKNGGGYFEFGDKAFTSDIKQDVEEDGGVFESPNEDSSGKQLENLFYKGGIEIGKPFKTKHDSMDPKQSDNNFSVLLKKTAAKKVEEINPETDTVEDGSPAPDSADLERSSCYRDPANSIGDITKKLQKFVHFFRNIRHDEEEDGGVFESPNEASSGKQSDTFYYKGEIEKSEPFKTKHDSMDPKQNDTNLKLLLKAEAAVQVESMGFESIDIKAAIADYIKVKANVNFGVNDLLDNIEKKGPRQKKVVALSDWNR